MWPPKLQHPRHSDARQALAQFVAGGDRFALASQVLAEFIHIVTDSRRFTQPLSMDDARRVAEQWWTAADVDHISPSDAATRQFLAWLQQFALGRKRLLDTLLAATYHAAGVQSLFTTNPADFAVFGIFNCVAW